MTLYDINEKMLSLVDPETGELMDYEAFTTLALEREEKLENTCKWIKELTAEAEAIKAEIKVLQDRQRAKEHRADSLRSYLALILNGETFECPAARVSYRSSTALKVDDLDAAAAWLEQNGQVDLVTHPAPKLDANEVKKLLKGGTEIPGVSLETRRNISVR